ncbi:hypothetical protein PLESTB_000280300 [Pleodorina starrii]|uniref:Uncharacterized protein n=1 Tax=Pleodorina starrii TaxID=330485 RepID=A0A9W6BCY4_9CHLO|nr:hypothetical protein PLESTB_000280300 [Pleodorina starrii]
MSFGCRPVLQPLEGAAPAVPGGGLLDGSRGSNSPAITTTTAAPVTIADHGHGPGASAGTLRGPGRFVAGDTHAQLPAGADGGDGAGPSALLAAVGTTAAATGPAGEGGGALVVDPLLSQLHLEYEKLLENKAFEKRLRAYLCKKDISKIMPYCTNEGLPWTLREVACYGVALQKLRGHGAAAPAQASTPFDVESAVRFLDHVKTGGAAGKLPHGAYEPPSKVAAVMRKAVAKYDILAFIEGQDRNKKAPVVAAPAQAQAPALHQQPPAIGAGRSGPALAAVDPGAGNAPRPMTAGNKVAGDKSTKPPETGLPAHTPALHYSAAAEAVAEATKDAIPGQIQKLQSTVTGLQDKFAELAEDVQKLHSRSNQVYELLLKHLGGAAVESTLDPRRSCLYGIVKGIISSSLVDIETTDKLQDIALQLAHNKNLEPKPQLTEIVELWDMATAAAQAGGSVAVPGGITTPTPAKATRPAEQDDKATGKKQKTSESPANH